VWNYIYFTSGIGPSLTLQDKNLTSIYFELPEKELNYKLYSQNVFNTVKFEKRLVDFYSHWKISQFLLEAEVEHTAC
jgi:hypothetical protein